jgi:hypothetical protein
MKINSNTISIDKKSAEYQALERVVLKVAAQNGIKDVESVQIKLSEDQGIMGFKTSEVDFSQAHITDSTSDEKVTEKEDPKIDESGASSKSSDPKVDPVGQAGTDPQNEA